MTRFAPLTERDKFVLEEIADGRTDQEIANRLGASLSVVRAIVSRKLLVRFGARNRTHLTRKAIAKGVLKT